jgi:ferric-dicitrate binding protein FerR (iron transport regulator)
MSLYEDLSRLLEGDLPEADADALRRQIAEDPAVARAWAQVQNLKEDLVALEDEPPPRTLDQRVLDRVTARHPVQARPPTRSRTTWIAIAGLAVGAAALLVLAPWDTAEVLLVDGSEWVDGRARVQAADVWVEVDGRALVSVEPRGGSVRVPVEEDPMNVTSHLAAAVAGAAITVAVYEGSARIFPPEAEPITVAAGESRTLRPPASEAAPESTAVPVVRAVRMGPEGTADLSPKPADAKERIAALEAELEQLRFEQALTRGQLVQTRGEPMAWPDKVDPSLEPETFEQRLQEALSEAEAGDLLAIDCEEYPCIAYVELDPELGMDQLAPMLQSIADKVRGDSDPAVMQMVRATGEGGADQKLLTMALMPREETEDLGRRVEYRAESAMEDYAHGEGGP